MKYNKKQTEKPPPLPTTLPPLGQQQIKVTSSYHTNNSFKDHHHHAGTMNLNSNSFRGHQQSSPVRSTTTWHQHYSSSTAGSPQSYSNNFINHERSANVAAAVAG